MTKKRILNMISEIARKEKVPPELIGAIVAVESSFDPLAETPYARGLMMVSQLALKDTELPFKYSELFDPEKNLLAGTRYVKRLYHYWAWQLARWRVPEPLFDPLLYNFVLLSYNWGIGNVKKWLTETPPDNAAIIRSLNPEPRDYLHKVNNWVVKLSRKEVE